MALANRLAALAAALCLPAAVAAQALPKGDVPASFVPAAADEDFVERMVMIPMRDGVKLRTFIAMPKGTHDAPIILSRTPYNAANRVHRTDSPHLIARLMPSDDIYVAAGYIRVYQDVRGKYGSEGDYEMIRPFKGTTFNRSTTDNTTDAWDTIDWLVKNVPESNGKVGMIGSSYGGFTTAAALLDPHPALKAAVPECPAIDAWMGDDLFHYGAFRQPSFDYLAQQTGQRGAGRGVRRGAYDDYATFLAAGSAADYASANGLDQLPYWRRILDHPDYDAFWQEQAFDKLLAKAKPTVPTLWQQGLWDQEDMWGATHAYAELKAAGQGATNWIVMGPWYHSQGSAFDGASLGPFKWTGETGDQYRRQLVLPFFEQYLRGGPDAKLARATIYNPSENRWQRFEAWPTACASGCARPLTPLYLQAGFGLSFDKPASRDGGDSYVSDPAKPVPHLPRPVRLGDEDRWRTWLVQDQRYVDGRPDVLMYQTVPLTEAMKLEGAPVVDLVATTTGTDGDFVVRLVDVYPGEYPRQPELGGYELPIATDIFRGRFRDSFEHPTPIPAGKPQHYRFTLPMQNYTVLPGHRIMVQIQSTLFPLYDRNPQSFVANPQKAKPGDYRKATVTILHSATQPSAILLPLVPLEDSATPTS